MSPSSSDADRPAADSESAPGVSSSRQLCTTVIDATAPRARMGRIAIVGVSLAIAAALGSVAGALAGSALSRNVPEQPAINANAVNERLAQLSSDIDSLKSKLDAANRNTGTQFSSVTDRLDRAEKAAAEPAARIAKISEAVERMERKSVASADVTGSIVPKQEDRPPVVEGWVLREIEDGRALVQSRLGYFEVGPGSNLPGIGRVEGIRRDEGRWVVVTAKGLIVSSAARR